MGMPPTPAAPRTFPNDPNPPPEAPEPGKFTMEPAGSSTSAGTGALPPAAQGAQGADLPSGRSYSVVEWPDGSRHAMVEDSEGPHEVGTVGLPKDDADKILHAVGRYDEQRKVWDGVPEETIKALQTGRPGFPAEIAKSLAGGESGVVQAFNALAFVQGKMSRGEAEARNQDELLKTQLAPGSEGAAFAWNKLGDYAADALKHPVNALLGAGKYAASQIAGMAPAAWEVSKGAVTGAVEAAGPATAAAMATGTIELPPVAAGLTFLKSAGALAGASKTLINLETGTMAAQMMKQGYDDKTIRNYATAAGAAKGVLWMTGFRFLPAPGKQALLEALANSAPAQKIVESWLAKYGAEVAGGAGVNAAQEGVRQIFSNLAAQSAEKPELLTSGKESADLILNALVAGGVVSAAVGAGAGAYEKATGPKMPNPVPEEKPALAKEKTQRELPPALKKRMKGMDTLEARGEVKPFDSLKKGMEKETSKNILQMWSAKKNVDTVIGNQLAEEGRRAVPKADREALRWYIAADGDKARLQAAAGNPKFEGIKQDLERAQNLSPKVVEMAEKLRDYYNQVGEVSRKAGTIQEMRANYQNRVYMPEKAGEGPKTEPGSGLKLSSRHGKRAFYRSEFDAYAAGKRFAGDVFDAAADYGADMARVNANRQVADAMVSQGLAAWSTPNNTSEGWSQVGNVQKFKPLKNVDGSPMLDENENQMHAVYHLTAPEGLAKGLRPIVDPNFIKAVDALRGIQKYQGLVKTAALSASLYHDVTILAQKMAERDFAGTFLNMMPGVQDEMLAMPETQKLEQWAVGNGVMTSAAERNVDVLHSLLDQKDSPLAGLKETPGVKQMLGAVDAKTEYTFEKVQRLNKIYGFAKLMSEWVGDHPDATNDEVTAAGRGFAEHVNNTYGGQNWEARGWTKSNLSLMRLALLAPDWLVSNFSLVKNALGRGVQGGAARLQFATAFAGGMMALEGANKLFTGHFSDENEPGHELEIEIEPGVYVQPFRAAAGEVVKLVELAIKHQKDMGAMEYMRNKGSPASRLATIGLAGRDYYGRKIESPYEYLRAALTAAMPIPFGAQNLAAYLQSENPTIPGALMVTSGLARYQKSRGERD